ncbi:MAG: ribosome recycling factor [Bacilli bacterium]|nr:ribosome recycling factor [Bacilli bacterium]
MDAYVIEAKDRFEKTIASLKGQLAKLRSGRANPAMLEGIKCDYYGDKMDIVSLCSIQIPEPRQLYIKPYSREDIKTIAAAINAANLGINPAVEADGIRIVVPAMTEEIRKDIAKKAKAVGEEAKVGIRNVRRDILSLLKEDDSMSDDYKETVEKDLQKEVDAANKSIEDIVAEKTKEVMSI